MVLVIKKYNKWTGQITGRLETNINLINISNSRQENLFIKVVIDRYYYFIFVVVIDFATSKD